MCMCFRSLQSWKILTGLYYGGKPGGKGCKNGAVVKQLLAVAPNYV